MNRKVEGAPCGVLEVGMNAQVGGTWRVSRTLYTRPKSGAIAWNTHSTARLTLLTSLPFTTLPYPSFTTIPSSSMPVRGSQCFPRFPEAEGGGGGERHQPDPGGGVGQLLNQAA